LEFFYRRLCELYTPKFKPYCGVRYHRRPKWYRDRAVRFGVLTERNAERGSYLFAAGSYFVHLTPPYYMPAPEYVASVRELIQDMESEVAQ